MNYEFGDIVLVRFPFTNQSASKQRPAVVVSNREYNTIRPDLVLMAITSQLHATKALGETWIVDWQSAHLLKPSAVKPVFATIEQTLIIRRLGSLQMLDQSALRAAITAILARRRSDTTGSDAEVRALLLSFTAKRSRTVRSTQMRMGIRM